MLYSLLLAGGKSSRMGEDKRNLVYRGQTLVEHAMALLQQTGADKILISGDVPGHECMPDRIKGCGPLGGIHTALHAIAEEGHLDDALLLVIPVDMPLLDMKMLARLLANIGESDSCHYRGEIFPCLFRASRRMKAHLDALLTENMELGGKRSMKGLLGAFQESIVDTSKSERDRFMNLNSKDDWDRLLAGD